MNIFTKKNILFFKLLITIITSTNIFCKCNCNCCCKNQNNIIENKTNNTFSIIPKQKEKIKLEEDKKQKPKKERIEKERQEQINKEEEEKKRKEEEEKKRKEAAERIKKEDEEIQIYDKFPNDKYEYKEKLGKGNCGKVDKYYDKENNRYVAIKTIKKISEIEIKYSKILKHKNIIKTYDIFRVNDKYYIAMEICDKTLNKILENDNLYSNNQALIFYQLINGLEYLHNSGIVHCDIKTENILFSKDNILKIVDFGLSYYLKDKKKRHIVGGTLNCLPPDLLRAFIYDKSNVCNTYESDIWSCGIVLYEMLTRNKAFLYCKSNNKLLNELNNIEKYINNLPEDTDEDAKDILKKILKIEPEERITIKEIKKHRFYLRGYEEYKKIIK